MNKSNIQCHLECIDLTTSGGATPSSITDLMTPLNISSPSTGTTSMHSSIGKTNEAVAALGQNKQLKTISKLVSFFQRYIIHILLYYYLYGLRINDVIFWFQDFCPFESCALQFVTLP